MPPDDNRLEPSQQQATSGAPLRHILAAREEERRRLAREMHDEWGQHIAGLLLGLSRLEAEPDLREEVRAQLAWLSAIARKLDNDLDRLTLELRPPVLDDRGLAAALHTHLEHWRRISQVPVDFFCTGLDGEPLPPYVEATLYRCIQEALTNILKHARARRVGIILERRTEEVRVIVEDDGCGFDLEALERSPEMGRRLGLPGMRERLGGARGQLTIETALGSGTTLFVRIPLPAPPGDEPP